MSAEATFPVEVLREHTTALEAAISVCLADSGHRPVHKLRTETRRVEAELLLLAQLPEIPGHRDEATVLLKELKKLRRAAGEVRDFDVQRKLLDEYAEPDPDDEAHSSTNGARAQAAHAPAKGAAKKNSKARKPRSNNTNANSADSRDSDHSPAQSALQKGAGELGSHLDKQRDDAADDLLKLLKKRQTRAAAAAESLLKVLQPAEELALAPDDLLHHAGALLERDGLLGQKDVAELTEEELHTVRKAAKAARYLAETLPDHPEATEAAQRFEALQEAGGQWHDLLDLARASRRYLGKQHELTVALTTERDGKLDLYRQALAGEVSTHAYPGAAARKSKKPRRQSAPPAKKATKRPSTEARGNARGRQSSRRSSSKI